MSDIEEVTKATGKALDTANNFGGFISKFISAPLEEGMGIVQDKLRYIRWERQVRLMKKSEEFMNEIGSENSIKPIPLKFAIPLIQAATLEDDDYLQDLWAKLLVNFSNKDSDVKISRAYIDILEKLSPLEAKILLVIYSYPFNESEHRGVLTIDLPEKVTPYIHDEYTPNRDKYKIKDENIILALANLSRLGCIYPQKSIGGGDIFDIVMPTILGKYLVESVTLKNNINI